MRIVLNTRSNTAGAAASIVALAARLRAAGVDAMLNDWDNYENYDVALFMGYDHELERARAQNSAIRVGLCDPKQSRPEWIAAARAADFLLVSSVEQREAFLRLNGAVHVLYMFPLCTPLPRTHTDDGPLLLGYHGNRVHLEAMAHSVTPAIEALGRTRPTELVCVYDVRDAPITNALPNPALVPTRHVQYSDDPDPTATVPSTLIEALRNVDIGLVPNLLPVANRAAVLRRSATLDPALAYEPFDHVLRLKASSNPNRLYVFAQLGIPVVADVTPSLAQFVLDRVSGALAAGPHGWLYGLTWLAESAERRTAAARELAQRVGAAEALLVPDLLAFLVRPGVSRPVVLPGVPSAESDLAQLAGYARPSNRPTRERFRALLHRFRLRR